MPIVDSCYDRGQFFIPLSLNGSMPHHFILDTGAGISAIDAALAVKLQLPVIGRTELAGTGGVFDVDKVRIGRMQPLRRGRGVDELAWYGLTPTVQDLSPFVVPGIDVGEAGLLGNDYLQSFILQMQFNPPLLEITRPTGFFPPGTDPQRFIPFSLDRSTIIRVKATLDGWMETELRFDTGSATMTIDGPYLNITRAMWQALCARHPEYRVHHQLEAHGIGGPVKLDVGRVGRFDLGPLHFGETSVVIQPPSGIFASPDAIGFVALNLFEGDQWLTFDYPNGRLYL
ncbi:MAG TPA: aspartyl protease family protein [Polyangia bacterium]|jgi:hypothetical protein